MLYYDCLVKKTLSRLVVFLFGLRTYENTCHIIHQTKLCRLDCCLQLYNWSCSAPTGFAPSSLHPPRFKCSLTQLKQYYTAKVCTRYRKRLISIIVSQILPFCSIRFQRFPDYFSLLGFYSVM